MTTDPMTCTELETQLSDYLEGDLDAATREAAERHLAGCPHCAALVTDLRRLVTDAAALPVLRPSRDLWAGIGERIDTPVITLADARSQPHGRAARPRRSSAWPRAAAAAALVAVTVGITQELTTRSLGVPVVAGPTVRPEPGAGGIQSPGVRPTDDSTAPVALRSPGGGDAAGATANPRAEARPPASRAPTAALVSPVAMPVALAGEAVYDQEIASLRAVLQRRRAELDPSTVEVLERSMNVIDAAIEQSRAALAADPRSPFLGDRLSHALDQKVQILRTAAALPART